MGGRHHRPHVEVRKGDGAAIFFIDQDFPELGSATNLKKQEVRVAHSLVVEHLEKLQTMWKDLNGGKA